MHKIAKDNGTTAGEQQAPRAAKTLAGNLPKRAGGLKNHGARRRPKTGLTNSRRWATPSIFGRKVNFAWLSPSPHGEASLTSYLAIRAASWQHTLFRSFFALLTTTTSRTIARCWLLPNSLSCFLRLPQLLRDLRSGTNSLFISFNIEKPSHFA